MADPPLAAVVGIGPGNGRSLVQRFVREGYRVAMLTRSRDTLDDLESEFREATGFVCDATDRASVETAFDEIRGRLGEPDVLVYNAGIGVWGGLGDVDDADFERCWRVNALGLFLCADRTIPGMVERGNGVVVAIGAGAAWRGRAGTLAFAQAKAAQRSTAQSLAREWGPRGVHVAYVVIDGVIDTPKTRESFPDKPDAFFLDPDDIAESVFHLVRQPRSAWSFEIDLRPDIEEW